MKRILLTNDDGIFARGINAVAAALAPEYDVYMVAPDSQRSGASQSLTLGKPVYLREVQLEGLPNVHAFSLSGTPTDCVKFALGNLDIKPDLVVSGMNLGANIGTDVMYSGTIGAALEAAMDGFPSLALSLTRHDAKYVGDAAKSAKYAVDFYINNTSVCKLLSVNIPDMPYENIKGIRLAHLSELAHTPKFEKQPDGGYIIPFWELNPDESADTDSHLVSAGFVTWTPILHNLCCCEAFDSVRNAFEKWREIKI